MICRPAPQRSSATNSTQLRRHITWPSDNELHLLIDVGESPVFIRVSGTLDGRTGTNLDPVIREVISEGHLRFDLDIDGLDIVDPSGLDALSAFRHSIVSAGGTVTRVHGNAPPPAQPPSSSFVPGYRITPSPLRATPVSTATVVGAGA